jgi:uncharacterized protein YndB with AHSA1/START domain
VPNEKIVLIQSFSDKDGGVTRHPMAADWPLEILATTTFEGVGDGRTRITITWQPYNSDPAGHAAFDKGRTGMEHGFGGVFAKLEPYLEACKNRRADQYPPRFGTIARAGTFLPQNFPRLEVLQ